MLFDIRRCALKSIRQSLNKTCPGPRRHGNTGGKPKHALVFTDVERVAQFICNYAEEFGIPQPAAPRWRDDTAPIQRYKENEHSLAVQNKLSRGWRAFCRKKLLSVNMECLHPTYKGCIP
ncbi:hypothetical protein DPMN_087086 [Dreissena polymorpha]|uniref:Uncharacterized protein n=1 Tax=Dreissena polymorpha TaxID=45954 RepID=A0A9D4KRL5_DREPO|nr:hypothetical protein DPMN_087086 [Dreissena polymorpha]